MPISEYLTVREAADLLGVSLRTAQRMAADGRLRVALRVPGYRGPLLVERADVEALRARAVA